MFFHKRQSLKRQSSYCYIICFVLQGARCNQRSRGSLGLIILWRSLPNDDGTLGIFIEIIYEKKKSWFIEPWVTSGEMYKFGFLCYKFYNYRSLSSPIIIAFFSKKCVNFEVLLISNRTSDRRLKKRCWNCAGPTSAYSSSRNT